MKSYAHQLRCELNRRAPVLCSRAGGMSATFGSEDRMVNIETWRAVHILRGHTGGQNLTFFSG